jgi:hypothetical protein
MSASATAKIFATAELRLQVCAHFESYYRLLISRNTDGISEKSSNPAHEVNTFLKNQKMFLLSGLLPIMKPTYNVDGGYPTYNDLYRPRRGTIPNFESNSSLDKMIASMVRYLLAPSTDVAVHRSYAAIRLTLLVCDRVLST